MRYINPPPPPKTIKNINKKVICDSFVNEQLSKSYMPEKGSCLSVCLHQRWRLYYIQSNLVISNSLITNYYLSRSENLVPVLTLNYVNR